jgi:acyl dehydratase
VEAFKTSFESIKELKSFKGKLLGVSEWFQVSQERINQFADATEDHQWIHLDVEKSKLDSPYGQTIAHGFLILSLMPHLAKMTYEVNNLKMGINYGANKIRFVNAVKADANIRSIVELVELEETKNGAKIIIKNTIEIKNVVKPACIAELIALLIE